MNTVFSNMTQHIPMEINELIKFSEVDRF